MSKLVFILPDGTAQTVAAIPDTSAMRHAVDNGLPLDADCGGECMCATCHVHVDPRWFSKLEPAEEQEIDMLGIVDDPSPTSRLSCRIRMTERLDGLVLHLPPTHR